MPAVQLTTRRIEKPWGRRDLWPGFGDVPPGGAPVGEIWFEHEGAAAEPDLLVKYLFTSEKLSIQVHPDDQAARAHGYKRGKDEAWLILAAAPDAVIGLGLREAVSREALRAAALDGSIEDLLDWRSVKAGDVFYSPAGTVHAIGPGLTLVEVQQNVDLTYRLYDYGRPRELHLDDGIAVADPVPYVAAFLPREIAHGRRILADGPAFVLERWTGTGQAQLTPQPDRPLLLMPLAGTMAIDGAPLEAGTVWSVDTPVALESGADADLLVAYPGGGIIQDLR